MLMISRGLRACRGQGDARADFSIRVARIINSSEMSMEEPWKGPKTCTQLCQLEADWWVR